MKRTVATAEIVSKAMKNDNIISLKALDELNYGLCDGLTHEEI
jgi:broad specificity phosphatase PhoE